MSLMAASSCCCGGDCKCPAGTPNPSSVTATITIVDCCGTSHTVTRILSNEVTAPCGTCNICPRYVWYPTVTEGQSCSGFRCETISDWKCSNDCSANALAMIDTISIGTDGSFVIDPNYPELGYCQNWTISFTVTSAIPVENLNPSADYYQGQNCVSCRWGYGCLFYLDCDRTTVIMCKQGTATPLGTYVSCTGLFLERCGTNEGCMSISVVIS